MSASRAAHATRSIPVYADTIGRAVHIKMHPQPRTMAESTEVLRVLQQYGEVAMYKHLKHDPIFQAASTALAIYKESNSADDLIKASPIRFELGKSESDLHPSAYHGSAQVPAENEKNGDRWVNEEQAEPQNSHDKQEWLRSLATGQKLMREPVTSRHSSTGPNVAMQGRNNGWAQANSVQTPSSQTPKPFSSNPIPSSASATSLPYAPSPSSATTTTSEPENLEMRLTIHRSVLNHHAYIQRQHYYAGFRIDDKSMMAEDLELRVPVKGLMDCQIDKGETPLRIRQRREEEERARGGPRKTLQELWREGQNKRERGEEERVRRVQSYRRSQKQYGP